MFQRMGWAIRTAISVTLLFRSANATPTNATASQEELATDADATNTLFHNFLFIICGSLAAIIICWRVIIVSVKYVRLLACLTNDTQRYFAKPSQKYATFKKNLLYAPIFRKRHNREFQLSTAVNVGTLPTRVQLLFLIAYLGTNIAFCVVKIHWNQPLRIVAVEIRHRSGILAVVNMVPLFLMAARNNPLIHCLDMSFETFNLLHRWFGRIVVLQSLLHTLAWMFSTAKMSGWIVVGSSIKTDPQILFGVLATAALLAITIQAMSILRHAFYETFKQIHFALAILTIVGIWYHLRLSDLPQFKLLIVAVAIWGLERFIRIWRIVYRNVGRGGTKALVEALPGNTVRVTVDLARPWNFKPGQHAYLYMPSVGLWTSHPFSVAWSHEVENPNENSGIASNRQEALALRKTSMSFVIRARTGFTNSLLQRAEASPEGRLYTKCFAEGPYGGQHMMNSYGTVMLVAGGIGITHQVPYVRSLVAGYANGTVATRKILLVWIIQSPEHLEWIRPWMTEILAMDKRRDVLRIMLFISRPRSTKEIHSPSATVQMFPGRPNIETLLDMEVENQIGAMGVSVCGSGSLSDDVRRAVRSRQYLRNIDFVEEAFSW